MKAVFVLLTIVALATAVPLSLNQPDVETELNNGVSQGDPQPANKVQLKEESVSLGGEPTPNAAGDHFPVSQTTPGVYAFKESSEYVAPPPDADPKNKSVYGIQPDPVLLDRPEERHPMEVKTPLQGEWPCDPDVHVQIEMPALEFQQGFATPFLPLRYGCSDEYEAGREKASPEIRWSNPSGGVTAYSLQLLSMGDDSCPGTGPDFGKILWHIVDMNITSEKMVLREGASHDTRLIFGGKEEPNQWLEEYYSGPCPPPGATECYRIQILAHREQGWCQCGFQDMLFGRPDKREYVPWIYNGTQHDEPAKV